MDTLQERIAGEITLSDSPGSNMKKWRELFGISQVELAKYIKISTSTISDYEGNRRASPGVGIIKRFVGALFTIDQQRGGEVIRNLEKYNLPQEKDPFYMIKDFSAPISGTDFARIIDAKIVSNPNYLDTMKIFGYTLIDSLRVILEISPSEYPKLFGTTNERAFVFDQVSTGRSPMVVIRVAPIKPRIVVIQNVENLDKLAIKISQIEKIPLLTTKLTTEELKQRLSNL
ncbi:MAG: helix-turn-helix domain-containing protein [Candidatus Micrarchaeota archaeon]|nr:helix-turn-helix domain-containing protein [Candidatus Micrarchaeota archaeon]MDE1834410.1 helix-turn-helix domain-containing protein [Candidatus Micrarchaeota archaeon]MDE1858905.1 helix-turn-helix domain-containing protein [Candidatus Micrarchaeota archaeon]